MWAHLEFVAQGFAAVGKGPDSRLWLRSANPGVAHRQRSRPDGGSDRLTG